MNPFGELTPPSDSTSAHTAFNVAPADSANDWSGITPYERNPRAVRPAEGAVANGNGAIDLNWVYRSHVESNSLTVNLDSACARVAIESDDDTQVTDAGTQTTIIGFANGIHNNYRVSPAIYTPSLVANLAGCDAATTSAAGVTARPAPSENFSSVPCR